VQRLAGRNALVTGASTGIGRAIAVRFAAEGANVVINYPREQDKPDAEMTLALARAASGGSDESSTPKLVLIEADVSDEQQVSRMFASALQSFGSLEILANNAGILGTPAECHETSLADFDQVMGVNLRGAFLCSREAVRHFLTRGGGVIVNNSSVHQTIPKPKYLPYSISKGAIENLTKSMALEYAGRRIRVNAVGPGAVETPMNDAWIHDAAARSVVESHIPMGRPAGPEEIAAVFAFLASEEASYITGQTIYACGGLTLYPEFRTAWASGE
jgi:glucose 1-dehydrogenase